MSDKTTVRVTKETLNKLNRVQGWIQYNDAKVYTLDEIIDHLCDDKLKEIKTTKHPQ